MPEPDHTPPPGPTTDPQRGKAIPPDRPTAQARWFGGALLLVVAAVLVVNIVWVVRNFDGLRALGPGQRAPDFDLPTLRGDRVRSADLRGRVVLIDFWSITCPPCLKSLPHLNRVARRFADQPVTVLAIHVQGGPRWRPGVAAEAAEMGLRFPVLLDARSRVSDAYKVRVLPTTVLVDRRGRIRKVWRGAGDVSRYEDEIRRALRD